MDIKHTIKELLYKYVYQNWNIAIATKNDDLSLKNIKWMKHSYKDRWFADPFIIDDTEDAYVVLVEEFMHSTRQGRLARLTVSKDSFSLLKNETILDIATHLSFPNPIVIDGKVYIYPENGAAGNTKYYTYGEELKQKGVLSELPLSDAIITKINGKYYILATLGEDCNGNNLRIYKSDTPLSGYKECQRIRFKDNTARRAGNVFEWNGQLISPAQVCNNDYGEGISLQVLEIVDGQISLKEIKRMMPPTKEYSEGFHTYNLYKNNVVVIDGYRYGSKILHNLYFKIRK